MMRKKKWETIKHIFLIVVTFLQIAPVSLVFINSFRTDKAIKIFPIGLPNLFSFQNYIDAWEKGEYFIAFQNSIKISGITAILVTILAILGGYVLAKSKMKWIRIIAIYFIGSLSLPFFLYFIQIYFLFSEVNLINSHIGVILLYVVIFLPFHMLLARTFIQGIPDEIEEAAIIDGCSQFQLLRYIIFPLSKPIIVTIVLLVFISSWNEFVIANTFLQKLELMTVATRHVVFTTQFDANLAMIFTASAITILPIIIIYIFLQDKLIKGFSAGSIKG